MIVSSCLEIPGLISCFTGLYYKPREPGKKTRVFFQSLGIRSHQARGRVAGPDPT